MKLSGNKLSTDHYIKSTGKHQYHHDTSSHPEHMKKSVVYSQALKLSRTGSEEKYFEKYLWNEIVVFTERIPPKLIETETSKVKFSVERIFHRAKVENGVPLVVTYHPLLKSIGKIICDNLNLFYVNE